LLELLWYIVASKFLAAVIMSLSEVEGDKAFKALPLYKSINITWKYEEIYSYS
jgi:hypothetical protein